MDKACSKMEKFLLLIVLLLLTSKQYDTSYKVHLLVSRNCLTWIIYILEEVFCLMSTLTKTVLYIKYTNSVSYVCMEKEQH